MIEYDTSFDIQRPTWLPWFRPVQAYKVSWSSEEFLQVNPPCERYVRNIRGK